MSKRKKSTGHVKGKVKRFDKGKKQRIDRIRAARKRKADTFAINFGANANQIQNVYDKENIVSPLSHEFYKCTQLIPRE